MHDLRKTSYGKTSKKSRKPHQRSENYASSGPRVTFRGLKVLGNTLKVTRGHPQSYSRIGSKFAYHAALLFRFYPLGKTHFNT